MEKLTHALISLAEVIRKNLDKGNICSGIFVDLQKAFDTVEHDILLAKLEQYAVIYPSSFLAHFWKKIEFLNVILQEKWSQKYPTMKLGILRHCKLCGGSIAEP